MFLNFKVTLLSPVVVWTVTGTVGKTGHKRFFNILQTPTQRWFFAMPNTFETFTSHCHAQNDTRMVKQLIQPCGIQKI
jgi:hypothetical protein